MRPWEIGGLMVLIVGALGADPADLSPFQDRFHRPLPVVAVVAQNAFTESTDFLVPWGILKASGAFEVHALGLDRGPVQFFPALTVQLDQTIADFDSQYPEGADYVIVPAVHRPDDPRLVAWVRDQARKGATVAGVCDGVLVVARTGILEGRKATGHWMSLEGLGREYPGTHWVRNRRFVQDGPVITTTGVTASVPFALALVAAVAGPDRAASTARTLGLSDLGVAHRSADYGFGWDESWAYGANFLAFWAHESLAVPVASGVDEVSLALLTDAYGRTGRATVLAVADSAGPVVTRGGLTLVPDRSGPQAYEGARRVDLPAQGLDQAALWNDLGARYGRGTASLVRMQVEAPRE